MADRKSDHSEGEEKLREELDRMKGELDLTRKRYEMEIDQLMLINRTLKTEKTGLEKDFEHQRCDDERKLRQLIFDRNKAGRQHADEIKKLNKDFEATQTGMLTELVMLREELIEALKLSSEKDEQIEALNKKMADYAELVTVRQELDKAAKLNVEKEKQIDALNKNMFDYEHLKIEVSKLNLIMEQKDAQMELLLRHLGTGLAQRREIEQQAEAVQKLEICKKSEADQKLEGVNVMAPEAAQKRDSGKEVPSQQKGEMQMTRRGNFYTAPEDRQGFLGYKPFWCIRCGRRYFTEYPKDLHQAKCEPQQDHSNNRKKNPDWKPWFRKN